MTCPSCETAEQNPLTGAYHAGCDECEARAIANSPLYFDLCKDESIKHFYRKTLEKIFPRRWQDAGERVKVWAKRIEEAKCKTA